MSGIVGLYRMDGTPVERHDLDAMMARLAHRGPDGRGDWRDGAVGFGHTLLRTTPESRLEQQPLRHRHAGLVLTADARLDNRDDLMAAFGCKSRGEITDSALILEAYIKWGTRCPEYLVGAFAFAIWDAQRAMVFGARDHMGMKPFVYYVQPGRMFAFGSEIKALLAVSDVPRRLNELRVGYHLAAVNEDDAITFYQDIVRLPPGHAITVRREAVRVQAYWTLDPEYELRLGSDAAYAEAFAEHFNEAVRCRLRHVGPVGCALSGGLDSSAVASVAARLLKDTPHNRLHTFSGIYDEVPACDERAFVQAVHAEGDYEPHYLRFDQLSPLGDLDRVFGHEDEPHPTPMMYFVWGLYRSAQEAGLRMLLDGVDGDTTVCHGYASLAELAQDRRWAAFVAEAQAVAQHEHLPSVVVMYQRYGVPVMQALARRGHWLSLAQAAQQLSVLNGRSWWQLVWNDALKPVTPEALRRIWRTWRGTSVAGGAGSALIRPEFAERIGLKGHIEAICGRRARLPRTAREEHWMTLTSGLIPYGFEMMDRVAAGCAVEARHPFADKRLVEFCLSLPAEQKLRQGWTRYIMRQGLASVLPEAIRNRGGKTPNSAATTRALRETDGPLMAAVIYGDLGLVADYINPDVLRDLYQRDLACQRGGNELAVWQTVTLALWLQYTGLSP